MTISMVLSIILAVGSGLGIGGNFAPRTGLNGSETQSTTKGINPVQHSE
ncbi:MAG: hypothetical protein LC803_16215 [Acidobacteria bacterium]|nr:hypothetical protein [Acidobacteriota bacterium]